MKTVAIHLIVVGDFNCDIDYSFFYTFKIFTDDNNLSLTDINKLCDAFTYNCSDSGYCLMDDGYVTPNLWNCPFHEIIIIIIIIITNDKFILP